MKDCNNSQNTSYRVYLPASSTVLILNINKTATVETPTSDTLTESDDQKNSSESKNFRRKQTTQTTRRKRKQIGRISDFSTSEFENSEIISTGSSERVKTDRIRISN